MLMNLKHRRVWDVRRTNCFEKVKNNDNNDMQTFKNKGKFLGTCIANWYTFPATNTYVIS